MNSYAGPSASLSSKATVATAPTGASQRYGRRLPAIVWLVGPRNTTAAAMAIVLSPRGHADPSPASIAVSTFHAAARLGARKNIQVTSKKTISIAQPIGRDIGTNQRRHSAPAARPI